MDIEKIINKLRQIGSDKCLDAMHAIEYLRNERAKAEQERDQYKERVAYLESAWQAKHLVRKDSIIAKQEKENDRLKSELESLRAQLKAAQDQEPIGHVDHSDCDVTGGERFIHIYADQDLKIGQKVYAAPIPAQPSPAVAVPDTSMVNLLRKVWKHGFDSENYDDIDFCNQITIAQSDDSPRITEQDARDIEDFLVGDYKREYVGQGIEQWLSSACRALINKLNAQKAQRQEVNGGSDV